MMWKIALTLAMLAVGCLLAPMILGAARRHRTKCVVLAFLLASAALLCGWSPGGVELSFEDSVRPIAVAGREDDPYASSESCRDCHRDEFETWHRSYHRTMTQVASVASVMGDFDDVRARVYGHDLHLQERDGQFWATMHDPEYPVTPSSEQIQRRIVMTTGSHHMQVYWYESGQDRRVGQLPLVWLNESRRWVPIHSIFIRPPQTTLGRSEGRWNQTCIKCHTTQGRPRIAMQSKPQVDTHVAEFGIACEACHGPGARHAASHRAADADSELVAMVNPAELDHRRSAEVCGQCHGVWTAIDPQQAATAQWDGLSYRPGQKLAESRHVFGSGQPTSSHVQEYLAADTTFIEDRFWSDGMVRVSGREYNGLVRSPCFQGGEMSCLSCHQMHPEQGATQAWRNDQLVPSHVGGDEACLQCHDMYRTAEALQAHTHHDPQSSGSRCYNCHMPYTTYGLLKAIRSHEISSPTTQETIQTGRPNACNQCHIDKTLPWVAESLQRWYGLQPPKFTAQQRRYSATLLAGLTGDAGQRVLAAWTLGWKPARVASRNDWVAPILGQLLDDPYDAVRYVAYCSLRSQPGYAGFSFDFLGSLQQRDEASMLVYRAWREQQNARRGDAALLIAEDGDLMHQDFAELLRLRNDRVVVLNE